MVFERCAPWEEKGELLFKETNGKTDGWDEKKKKKNCSMHCRSDSVLYFYLSSPQKEMP